MVKQATISALVCRPLCLLREKDSRQSVLEHFEPYIDAAHDMETPSKFNISDIEIDLPEDSGLSVIDGKIFKIIQVDSGSFCHYCKVTKNQGNDITCILQGFNIEKTVNEMKATWSNIEEGNISYSDPSRAGQCHEPMNHNNLSFFAILHQKLRSLDNCLKLLYHLVSGQTHTWSESSPNVRLALTAAKKEGIDLFF